MLNWSTIERVTDYFHFCGARHRDREKAPKKSLSASVCRKSEKLYVIRDVKRAGAKSEMS